MDKTNIAEEIESWKDCIIRGCGYKQCLRLSSVYCYPHSAEYLNIFDNRIDEQTRELIREAARKE